MIGIHHAIGNFILRTNTFAPPTSVDKQMVETMHSRSPIYHAQPHATGFLQQLMDHSDRPPNITVSTQTTINSAQHDWFLFLLIILGVALGLWWKYRRTNQRHLSDSDNPLV